MDWPVWPWILESMKMVGSVYIKVCCPVDSSGCSDVAGQHPAHSYHALIVRRCHLVAAGGIVLKRRSSMKRAFSSVPHTCGTQRMAFRDEPTAGVDHKFTSVGVVPSVDHLSGFTCRGLEMQCIFRGGLNKIHTLINMTHHKLSPKANIQLQDGAIKQWYWKMETLLLTWVYALSHGSQPWDTGVLRCWFNGVTEGEYDGLACCPRCQQNSHYRLIKDWNWLLKLSDIDRWRPGEGLVCGCWPRGPLRHPGSR